MSQSTQPKPFRFSIPMRAKFLIGVLMCTCGFFCSAVLSAQQVGDDLTFPYQAIVVKEGAPVRSGPGKIHYATGRLALNASVEVYRHDPGGWCAIRPTESCFSLIPESALEIIEEGIGEITEDGTQAWVGTALGPVDKPLWQIKLEKGEMVAVIGQASWPNPEGHSTTWYQVAPPAGEFRWVHISDLQLPPGQLAAEAKSIVRTYPGIATQVDGQIQQVTYQSDVSVKTPAFPRTLDDVNRGWRQANREERNNRFNNQEDVTAADGRSNGLDATSPYSQFSQPTPRNPYPYGNTSSPATGFPPERLASANVRSHFDLEQLGSGSFAGNQPRQPLSSRLNDLEVKLSNEMIKEPNQWRLIDLQTVANSIYQSTSDPRERLQAQQLLQKLENCAKIRAGYRQAYQAGGTATSGLVGSGVAQEELISLQTTYDAMGWLNELVRDGGTSSSTYVLQDDNGKITHHLAPGPGLNLHGYLKSKVGILGQRGYHQALDLNHVTVERVVVLEEKK